MIKQTLYTHDFWCIHDMPNFSLLFKKKILPTGFICQFFQIVKKYLNLRRSIVQTAID